MCAYYIFSEYFRIRSHSRTELSISIHPLLCGLASAVSKSMKMDLSFIMPNVNVHEAATRI